MQQIEEYYLELKIQKSKNEKRRAIISMMAAAQGSGNLKEGSWKNFLDSLEIKNERDGQEPNHDESLSELQKMGYDIEDK